MDRPDDAVFAHAVGPSSAKSHYFPARHLSVRTRLDALDGFVVEAPPEEEPVALVGIRPCDLAAIGVQARVLAVGNHPDPLYRDRLGSTVVVVAQCTDPAATCFCTSMGSGPVAEEGFDLALTELRDPQATPGSFLVEVGSSAGAALIAAIPNHPARDEDLARARARTDAAAASITRRVDTADLPGRLAATLEHPRWDDVAARCLTCANCTMVCPTCFCSTVEDVTDLEGDHAERWRRWDSCFSLAHSELHGGPVRSSARSRYRQWLTHKFGTWHDQFGESGCVGCGRCITWCPVGIDVTEELAALSVADPEPADPEPADPEPAYPEPGDPEGATS